MHLIPPLSSIPPLNPVHPPAVSLKEEPALQPSKQSLAAIPVTTPSLEELVLPKQSRKLKLSGIESKTQGSPSKVPPLFPQILLDLEVYTDPSEVFSFIESLTLHPIVYLRVPSALLSLVNISFIQTCQALGLKLFLDLDLSLTDLQRLPSLAYTGASLLSYYGPGASALGLEAAIQSHYQYLPTASMVFKSSHFGSLEKTMHTLKEVLSLYQTVLSYSSYSSLDLAQALPPAPYLLCQPEELAPLRQHFSHTLPLIVNAEYTWVEGPLEIAKLPSLHMASFILLGRSILDAQNPQLELEHIIRYLKSSF